MTTMNLCRRVVGRSIAVVVLGSAIAALAGASAQNDSTKQEWIQLFNGRNLDGWTPKFAKHDLGENFNDTVRVENGLLEVRYDKWQGFNGEFGHIFYRDSFCTIASSRGTGLSASRWPAVRPGRFATTV